MDHILKKEFEFYLAHQEEMVKKYNGKVIVIAGEKVVGVYDNDLDAVTEAKKTLQSGTFLVQKVTPGDTAYSQTFHSRVAFN